MKLFYSRLVYDKSRLKVLFCLFCSDRHLIRCLAELKMHKKPLNDF